MIENFITKELIDALAETGEYIFSENGFNISAKSTDGQISIQLTYDIAKKESEQFTEYLNTLEDNLFIEVCESLGGAELSVMSEKLTSGNIESVRTAIARFKIELRKILENKINYYTECLNNLDN